VLSATIVSSVLIHSEGNLQNALPIILGVFALSGLFQIALGAMKIGSYIRYVPRTVVSGFMTGIGAIILITQISPALGYIPSEDEVLIAEHMNAAEHILVEDAFRSAHESWLEHTPGDSTGHQLDIHHHLNFTDEDILRGARGIIQSESKGVIGAIRFIPSALGSINWIELILALSTIIIIYGFKRITSVIPSTLVALIAVTLVAYFGDFIYRPITAISTGFPAFQTGIFSISNLVNMGPYVGAALVLSLLGAIDSLLTSVVADNLTRTRHKPNQELIGQGIGNAVAGFFGGLPGAGATIRTVVNIQAGGRTRLSGVVAGVILFLVIVTLAPLASIIPQSVLAGILFTVGIGVMDYKGLRELRHMPWSDRIVLISVLVLTVTWQLVYAVALGLIMASFQFMRYMGEHTAGHFSVEMNQDIEGGVSSATKVLYGPLFFGNASALADLRETIPPSVKQLNIDMRRVHFVDQSGLAALEEILIDLTDQGVEVTIVGLLNQPRLRLDSSIDLQSIGVNIEEAKGGEFID
jgi:SulP family sulfate permease